jgi:hypothetical protein
MIKLEYIWLDGSKTQQIRSKTKIIKSEYVTEDLLREYKRGNKSAPVWNFDGSSTYQAETTKSEL